MELLMKEFRSKLTKWELFMEGFGAEVTKNSSNAPQKIGTSHGGLCRGLVCGD